MKVKDPLKTKNRQIALYGTWNLHYLQAPFSLQWKTIPGVDTIAGLPCYKATTQHGGRQYTAWYTTQIRSERRKFALKFLYFSPLLPVLLKELLIIG